MRRVSTIEMSQDLEISFVTDKIELAVGAAKKAGIEILKFYGKEVELEAKTDGYAIDPGGLCFSRFIVGCIVVYWHSDCLGRR